MCWNTNPQYSQNVTLSGNRDNQVKMRSLGWTLIQYDWYSIKRGDFNTETDIHREKTMWHTWGRRPCDCHDIYKPRTSKDCQQAPKAEEARRILQRERGAADTLISDGSPPELWDNTFPLFEATRFWVPATLAKQSSFIVHVLSSCVNKMDATFSGFVIKSRRRRVTSAQISFLESRTPFPVPSPPLCPTANQLSSLIRQDWVTWSLLNESLARWLESRWLAWIHHRGRNGYWGDSHRSHYNGQTQNLDEISLTHFCLWSSHMPCANRLCR